MTRQQGRERILAAGAALVHAKGFNNTGIQEVLDASGVPKGSFYHYFKSKEEFGLALVEHIAQYLRARAEEHLGDESLPPLVRLRRAYASFIKRLGEAGCAMGCPIGNLAQEMSDLSEPIRACLSRFMELKTDRVAGLVKEAQERGEVSLSLDPAEAAAFVIAAWQGSILCMKVHKSPRPLEIFDRMIFEIFLTTGPGSMEPSDMTKVTEPGGD